MAAHNGRDEAVQLLLRAASPVDAADAVGRTALHYAALKSHEGCIRLLLDANAKAGAVDSKGKTAEMLLGQVRQHQHYDHRPVMRCCLTISL